MGGGQKDIGVWAHMKPEKLGYSYFLNTLMPITFSSPRAQPEVVYFLIPNESPYFSDCKSKISTSNSL